MHVLAVRFTVRIVEARSLKDRRRAVRPVVDGIRHRFHLSCAEVGDADDLRSAAIGVGVVSSSARVCEETADEVERFVVARGDLEVVRVERAWVERSWDEW